MRRRCCLERHGIGAEHHAEREEVERGEGKHAGQFGLLLGSSAGVAAGSGESVVLPCPKNGGDSNGLQATLVPSGTSDLRRP